MNLFENIEKEDFNKLMTCLKAVKKSYQKDEVIFDEHSKITSLCYILSGNVQLSKTDYLGNILIIGNLTIKETFGETIICAKEDTARISVKTLSDSEILFIDIKRILSICTNSCPFHRQLIENVIKILAEKNVKLHNKIELLATKNLRERILKVLYANKTNDGVFEIPYSREEMANLIGADRSALSRELSKMKNEKLIDYHKNSFKIIGNLKRF